MPITGSFASFSKNGFQSTSRGTTIVGSYWDVFEHLSGSEQGALTRQMSYFNSNTNYLTIIARAQGADGICVSTLDSITNGIVGNITITSGDYSYLNKIRSVENKTLSAYGLTTTILGESSFSSSPAGFTLSILNSTTQISGNEYKLFVLGDDTSGSSGNSIVGNDILTRDDGEVNIVGYSYRPGSSTYPVKPYTTVLNPFGSDLLFQKELNWTTSSPQGEYTGVIGDGAPNPTNYFACGSVSDHLTANTFQPVITCFDYGHNLVWCKAGTTANNEQRVDISKSENYLYLATCESGNTSANPSLLKIDPTTGNIVAQTTFNITSQLGTGPTIDYLNGSLVYTITGADVPNGINYTSFVINLAEDLSINWSRTIGGNIDTLPTSAYFGTETVQFADNGAQASYLFSGVTQQLGTTPVLPALQTFTCRFPADGSIPGSGHYQITSLTTPPLDLYYQEYSMGQFTGGITLTDLPGASVLDASYSLNTYTSNVANTTQVVGSVNIG